MSNLAHYSRTTHTQLKVKLTTCVVLLVFSILLNLSVICFSHLFLPSCDFETVINNFQNSTIVNRFIEILFKTLK